MYSFYIFLGLMASVYKQYTVMVRGGQVSQCTNAECEFSVLHRTALSPPLFWPRERGQ